MKLSSLAGFLEGKHSAVAYRAEIAEELERHLAGLRGPARVAPVEAAEDRDLIFGPREFGRLCSLYASGQLSAEELAYAADVLELSERVEFASESVAHDLGLCTDPEINGPMSAERALALSGHYNAA